jgi:hypothetical protein
MVVGANEMNADTDNGVEARIRKLKERDAELHGSISSMLSAYSSKGSDSEKSAGDLPDDPPPPATVATTMAAVVSKLQGENGALRGQIQEMRRELRATAKQQMWVQDIRSELAETKETLAHEQAAAAEQKDRLLEQLEQLERQRRESEAAQAAQLERQRRESQAAQEDSPAVSPDLSPQGAPRRVAVAAGFLLSCLLLTGCLSGLSHGPGSSAALQTPAKAGSGLQQQCAELRSSNEKVRARSRQFGPAAPRSVLNARAAAAEARAHGCPGRPGRLSALGVFLCKSVFDGAFVGARRGLNMQKRRFSARAVPPAARGREGSRGRGRPAGGGRAAGG